MNIQSELKAPKSQYNSFGKYHYRNVEDILEALKPLLLKYDCSLFISDTVEMIGERYYIKSTVTFVDNETGNKVEVVGYAREEQDKKGFDQMQLTGATSSYARKYALNGMFAIDDTKDSDTTNTHGNDKPQNTPQQEKPQTQTNSNTTVEEKHTKALYASWKAKKIADDEVKEKIKKDFGKTDSRQLTMSEFNALMDWIKSHE